MAPLWQRRQQRGFGGGQDGGNKKKKKKTSLGTKEPKNHLPHSSVGLFWKEAESRPQVRTTDEHERETQRWSEMI